MAETTVDMPLLSPPGSPTRHADVPEITIPSKWYPWFLAGTDKPSTSTSLVDERCDTCGWDGQDDTLFRYHYRLELEDLEGRQCVSCQSLLLAGREVLQHLSSQDEPDERDAARYHCWNMQVTYPAPRLRPAQSTFSFGQGKTDISSSFFIPPHDGSDTGNPWDLPIRKIMTPDPLAQASTRWARERLDECSGNHQDCVPETSQSRFIPTRLLAVNPFENSNDVKLVLASDLATESVKYAAVSYVWGDSILQAESKTTQDNIAQHVERISWAKIPRTLQDNITFTRNIGLDYIWIDSFCIIQNDADEWSREASRMFDVYKQSYVLLAALWSSDCSKGLASSPDTYCGKQIATLRLGQHTWPLHAAREHEVLDLKYFWQSQRPPLFKRAWCFQERSVSPRCLFFGRNELIFGCHRQVTCQCGIKYLDENGQPLKVDNMNPSHSKQEHAWRAAEQNETSEDTREDLPVVNEGTSLHRIRWIEQNPQQAWVEILEEYSRLRLTNENERLIAVGGVAQQLSFARPGETYLAGLWSGSFIRDLLWRVPRYHDGKTNPDVPSWSWAHHANPVQYGRYGDVAPTAEVVEAACSYRDGNPFGMLLDSRLVLRGRLMQWWSTPSKLLGKIPWLRSHRAFSWDSRLISKPPDFSVISDDHHWEKVPENCYLFEVGYAKQNENLRFFLILQSDETRPQTFSRIGVLQDWMTFEPDKHHISPDLKALNSVFVKKSTTTSITLV